MKTKKITKLIFSLMLLLLSGFMSMAFFQTGAQKQNTSSQHKLPVAPVVNKDTKLNAAIPQKVYDMLTYVRKNHHAPDGYQGGRTFKNYEGRLAKKTSTGTYIHYQEWDVNPLSHEHNRGTERLITGDDNRAWYTNDHYQTFTEVKLK